MRAKTGIEIAKQAITAAYLLVSQAGIILGEQSRSAHSSIIAINEFHNYKRVWWWNQRANF